MGWGRRIGAAIAIVVAAAACGTGPDFQYFESDDGHLFGKIPSDWNVEREGAIAYALIDPNQVQFAFTPGDETQPWRAEFEAPGAAGDVPSGSFLAQHIDARQRSSFRLFEFLDSQVETARSNGLEVIDYERRGLRMDGYVGYRVSYTIVADGDETRFDEVYVIDDRRSGMYAASLSCDAACHEEFADEINEVLTTFRVEP